VKHTGTPRRTKKDEEIESPRDKLTSFMRKHARDDIDIEHYSILINEALKRPSLPNKDVANKAKQIADTAANFGKALENALAIYTDCTGVIGDAGVWREGPESVWPYLRIARLMSPDEFDGDSPSALRFGEISREARIFDRACGQIPMTAFLSQVQAIARHAEIASKTFIRRGAPRKVKTSQLYFELGNIWKNLSGKEPGYSGDWTFHNPRSYFEKFVKLAIGTTAWDTSEQKSAIIGIHGFLGRKKPKK
jgi:hypothetical protein